MSRGLSSRASSRPFSQGGKPKFATSFDKNDVWMELFLPRDPRNPNAERPKRFENMNTGEWSRRLPRGATAHGEAMPFDGTASEVWVQPRDANGNSFYFDLASGATTRTVPATEATHAARALCSAAAQGHMARVRSLLGVEEKREKKKEEEEVNEEEETKELTFTALEQQLKQKKAEAEAEAAKNAAAQQAEENRINSDEMKALVAFKTRGDRRTALLHAAARNQTDACRALLDHGADVHARDRQGFTALMLSAAHSHLSAVVPSVLDRGPTPGATAAAPAASYVGHRLRPPPMWTYRKDPRIDTGSETWTHKETGEVVTTRPRDLDASEPSYEDVVEAISEKMRLRAAEGPSRDSAAKHTVVD